MNDYQIKMDYDECRCLLGLAEYEVMNLERDLPALTEYAERERLTGRSHMNHVALKEARKRHGSLQAVAKRLRRACG